MDLKIFSCGAYVYLPEEKHQNKLAPRSELMTYLGVHAGTKGYMFMRPSGSVFISTKALFDETLFPRCGDKAAPPITDLGDFPPDEPEDHNHSDGTDDDDDNDLDRPSPDPPLPESSNDDDGYNPKEPSAPKDAADEPPTSPPVTQRDFEPRREDQTEWQQLPRRSGRTRNPPNRPGNVYGDNRLPSDVERDIARDRYWNRTVGQDSTSYRRRPQAQREEPVAGPSSAPQNDVPDSINREEPDPSMQGTDDVGYIIKIAREGGTNLMCWLLTKAVIPSNAKEQVPTQFCDIACLLAQQQAEWKQACREELEALRKRQVYEIVDLPHG